MISELIALHMGGIPETAMVLGPVLLIAAFVRIARRNEATDSSDEDWDADLGDLGRGTTTGPAGAVARGDGAADSPTVGARSIRTTSQTD